MNHAQIAKEAKAALDKKKAASHDFLKKKKYILYFKFDPTTFFFIHKFFSSKIVSLLDQTNLKDSKTLLQECLQQKKCFHWLLQQFQLIGEE